MTGALDDRHRERERRVFACVLLFCVPSAAGRDIAPIRSGGRSLAPQFEGRRATEVGLDILGVVGDMFEACADLPQPEQKPYLEFLDEMMGTFASWGFIWMKYAGMACGAFLLLLLARIAWSCLCTAYRCGGMLVEDGGPVWWLPFVTSYLGAVYLLYAFTLPIAGFPIYSSKAGGDDGSSFDKWVYPNPPHFAASGPNDRWAKALIQQLFNGVAITVVPFLLGVLVVVGLGVVLSYPFLLLSLAVLFWIASCADAKYRSEKKMILEWKQIEMEAEDSGPSGASAGAHAGNCGSICGKARDVVFSLFSATIRTAEFYADVLLVLASLQGVIEYSPKSSPLLDVETIPPQWWDSFLTIPEVPCLRLRTFWPSCASYALLNTMLYFFVCSLGVYTIVTCDVITMIDDRVDRCRRHRQDLEAARRGKGHCKGRFAWCKLLFEALERGLLELTSWLALYLTQLLAAQGAMYGLIVARLLFWHTGSWENWETETLERFFAFLVDETPNEVGVTCYGAHFLVTKLFGSVLLLLSVRAVYRVCSGHIHKEQAYITSASYFYARGPYKKTSRFQRLHMVMKVALFSYISPFVSAGLDSGKLDQFKKWTPSGTTRRDVRKQVRREMDPTDEGTGRTRAMAALRLVKKRLLSLVSAELQHIQDLDEMHFHQERKQHYLEAYSIGGRTSTMRDYYKSCDRRREATTACGYISTLVRMVFGCFRTPQLYSMDCEARSRLWQAHLEHALGQSVAAATTIVQLVPFVGTPVGKVMEYMNAAHSLHTEDRHLASRSLRAPDQARADGAAGPFTETRVAPAAPDHQDDACLEGEGTMLYRDGALYKGQWDYSHRHGSGTCVYGKSAIKAIWENGAPKTGVYLLPKEEPREEADEARKGYHGRALFQAYRGTWKGAGEDGDAVLDFRDLERPDSFVDPDAETEETLVVLAGRQARMLHKHPDRAVAAGAATPRRADPVAEAVAGLQKVMSDLEKEEIPRPPATNKELRLSSRSLQDVNGVYKRLEKSKGEFPRRADGGVVVFEQTSEPALYCMVMYTGAVRKEGPAWGIAELSNGELRYILNLAEDPGNPETAEPPPTGWKLPPKQEEEEEEDDDAEGLTVKMRAEHGIWRYLFSILKVALLFLAVATDLLFTLTGAAVLLGAVLLLSFVEDVMVSCDSRGQSRRGETESLSSGSRS